MDLFAPKMDLNGSKRELSYRNIVHMVFERPWGVFAGDKFGTQNDSITIVAAHWDTVSDSPGFDDNGSGMAALLEIARVLGNFKSTFQ